MATLEDLLAEALKKLGQRGESLDSDYALDVKAQLIRTYRVRIPQFAASHLRQGSHTMTVADSGNPISGDATGEYAWPESLNAPRKPLILQPAVGAELHPHWFSHPLDFWTWLGMDESDLTAGQPSAVLWFDETFLLRPRPDPVDGPWTVKIYGNFYPDAPGDADSIRLELEDAVVAGGVLFQAIDDGSDEIVQRFTPLWEAALRNIQNTHVAGHRAVPHRPDF